jgi:hypothetical protein
MYDPEKSTVTTCPAVLIVAAAVVEAKVASDAKPLMVTV